MEIKKNVEFDKKVDVRVKRTFKRLVDGMLELLSTKMLDDISVLEICEISGVHRATFYKHFEDKYAFVRFCFETMLNELPCDKLLVSAANEECRGAYADIVREVVKFAESHRQLIRNVTDVNQSQLFVSLFSDVVADLLEKVIRTRAESRDMCATASSFLANYYAGAVVNLLRWWVVNGDEFSAADVVKFFDEHLDNLIFAYSQNKSV